MSVRETFKHGSDKTFAATDGVRALDAILGSERLLAAYHRYFEKLHRERFR